MRIIAIVILVGGILWTVGIKWQEASRVPVARDLIAKKSAELQAMDFAALAAKAGSGTQTQTVVIEGVQYDISYAVERKDEALTIKGKVDCITIIPFYRRIGPSFEITLTQDLSYHEQQP